MKHGPGLEGAPRGSCRQGTSHLGLGREGGCLREPVGEGRASRSVMETVSGALSLVDSPPGRRAHKSFGRTQSNRCFFSREGIVSNSGGRLCASILSLRLESRRGSRAPSAADALVPGAHGAPRGGCSFAQEGGGGFGFLSVPSDPQVRGVSFLRRLGLAGDQGRRVGFVSVPSRPLA